MIKRLIPKFGKTEASPGQSLAEMAIIAPLLIFMLIGVFEVGWALRGYLVLVNVNREITRFAVRPGYMDFSTYTTIEESFLKVRNWVDTSLGNQLDLNFAADGNATLIISHVVVNTGLPCSQKDIDLGKCDCSQVIDNDYKNLFPTDDFYIHPQMPGQEHQTKTYPDPTTAVNPKTTRMNFEALITNTLKPQNNQLNCEVIKKGGVASDNNFIVTELFFEQPQLFGFPLISNPLTDPVPLYSHTIMRLVGATRGNLTQNVNTIGPVCFAYPIIIHEDLVPATPNTTIPDLLDGASNHNPGTTSSANERGFLAWNPYTTLDVSTLEEELDFPQLSITDYTNAVDPNDKSLSVGDYVKSLPGNNGGVNDSSNPRLDALVGQEIVIPVWKTWNEGASAYKVERFIRVRLTAKEVDGGISLTGNNPVIEAVYLGPDEICNQVH